jgi:hypothetical protein
VVRSLWGDPRKPSNVGVAGDECDEETKIQAELRALPDDGEALRAHQLDLHREQRRRGRKSVKAEGSTLYDKYDDNGDFKL